MNKHAGFLRAHRAFTLVELLVVIAIIILLLSLLFPTVTGSLRRARRLQCLNNLRNIGQVALLYNQRYGQLPTANGHDPTKWWSGETDINSIKAVMDEMRLPAAIWYCPELGRQGSNRTPAHPDSWAFFTTNSTRVVLGYAYVANPTGFSTNNWHPKWPRNPKFYQGLSQSSRAPLAVDMCEANRPGASVPATEADWLFFPHDGIENPKISNVVRMDGSAQAVNLANLSVGFSYYGPLDIYWTTE